MTKTNAVVVAFLIAGFVGMADAVKGEDITSFKDIPTQKTTAGQMNWGSENIGDMMGNLENLNKAVNRFGFKKTGLLMSQIAIEKIMQTDLYDNPKVQGAVFVMISKNNEKFTKMYGRDYKNSEKYKADMEFAKSLPDVSHNAMSDLTMYLPKVMDKADEVLTQVNTNTKAIDGKISTSDFDTYKNATNTSLEGKLDQSEFNTYKETATKALESYVKADASNIDAAVWKETLGLPEETGSMEYVVVTATPDPKKPNEKLTNTVNGKNSIAVGTGLTVNGNNSGAFGDPTIINGDGSYSVGNDNQIAGNNNFILGNNVVIDTDAKGKKITDSVALGNNSEVKESNVVSVGAEGAERRIVNVAAGEKDTDAANLGQVRALAENTERIGRAVEENREELRSASALTAALAGLHPMDYREGQKTQVQAAVGSYRDKQAIAVGASHHLNEDLMLSAGISLAEGKRVESAVNVGLSWRLGEALDRRDIPESARVAKLEKENKEMKARLEKLEKLLSK